MASILAALTHASHAWAQDAAAAVATDASVDASAVDAADPSGTDDDDRGITVRADRPFSTASATTVRDRDLSMRPRSRPGDIFEVAPGLIVVQHAGGGKSNQYFLRGFDADHGTDFAFSVDGVPINNVSHAHGQGYTDPHFLIPELVERVDVQEGPYFAASGDFATAGAIDLRLRTSVARSSVAMEAGMFGRLRLLGIAQTNVGPIRGYIAAEIAHLDGPFVNPLNFNRYNAIGRWTAALRSNIDLTATIMSYAGGWNASGPVPARLIGRSYLGRFFSPFDSIDPSEGGQSQRDSISADLRVRGAAGNEFQALAYLVSYRLSLFSNFTYFASNPDRGDMIEQNDARVLGGLRASYRVRHTVGAWRFETIVGAQLRHDAIDNSLHRDEARVRYATVNQSNIQETAVGAYAQEDIRPTTWFRVVLGLRADLFAFAAEDRRTGAVLPDPERAGTRAAGLLSPKATVVLTPARNLDFYLNFGTGFHSNDARGVVRLRDRVTPLTRAIGYEVGARWRIPQRLELALAAWGLELESEIVWVGDAGTTEARGPTRRLGITFEGRADITPWLRADVDVALVNATYTQNAPNANAVALAPPFTVAAGVSVQHPRGLFGAIRVRAIGDRPAIEDRSLTAQGFAIFSAQFGYRQRLFEIAMLAENFFDASWREAQFAGESRLRSEPRAVSDIHFTPGTPFSASLRLTLFAP